MGFRVEGLGFWVLGFRVQAARFKIRRSRDILSRMTPVARFFKGVRFGFYGRGLVVDSEIEGYSCRL